MEAKHSGKKKNKTKTVDTINPAVANEIDLASGRAFIIIYKKKKKKAHP